MNTGQPVSFGSFGSTPDHVLATDFYDFFHLGEARRVTDDRGDTTVSYRTSGRFHGLVVLDVAAGADMRTEWLSLQVARSFVDEPRDGWFARDVVASFIREGTADQGYEDGFATLLQDLRTRPLERRREVVYTDSNPLPPAPRLPGDFSSAFAVYSGADAWFATRLAHIDLRMSNDRFDGVGALTVSLHRQR